MRITHGNTGGWMLLGDPSLPGYNFDHYRDLFELRTKYDMNFYFGENNMDTWYETAKEFDILHSHNYARIADMLRDGKTEEDVELYCEELVWEKLKEMKRGIDGGIDNRLDVYREEQKREAKDNGKQIGTLIFWNTGITIILIIVIVKAFFF